MSINHSKKDSSGWNSHHPISPEMKATSSISQTGLELRSIAKKNNGMSWVRWNLFLSASSQLNDMFKLYFLPISTSF